MRVVIAGGTGFLGRTLQNYLRTQGHVVTVLTRQSAAAAQHVTWLPDGTTGPWAAALEHADAVVNLAGDGLADARWSDARKAQLRSSRILSTRSLVHAIRGTANPPRTFVSVSGVGYYGDRGAEVVTEASPPGKDFLAQLCADWEREAEHAAGIARVVRMRNGVVLHPSSGALKQMLLPFRLGVGGRIGSGTQYLAWIHRSDWVALVKWLVDTAEASGAFNVTAPSPATNADFTRALGRALHRPAVMPVPGVALRLLYGEIADTLVTGQRAVPARALEMGFRFKYDAIEPALRDLLR